MTVGLWSQTRFGRLVDYVLDWYSEIRVGDPESLSFTPAWSDRFQPYRTDDMRRTSWGASAG